MRNIDLLSDKNIQVVIRLNIDFYNKFDIRLLIEELGKRYSDNDQITVYLNMLFNNQGFEPVHRSLKEQIELLDIIEDYSKRIEDLKLGHKRIRIPSLAFSQCMADDSHAIEIQPDGSFCRCEHESVLDSYGTLDKGIFDPQKLSGWKEKVEYSGQCSDCVVYPSCYILRGCMNANEPCHEILRKKTQKMYIDHLLSIYLKKIVEEINNEKRVYDP